MIETILTGIAATMAILIFPYVIARQWEKGKQSARREEFSEISQIIQEKLSKGDFEVEKIEKK